MLREPGVLLYKTGSFGSMFWPKSQKLFGSTAQKLSGSTALSTGRAAPLRFLRMPDQSPQPSKRGDNLEGF